MVSPPDWLLTQQQKLPVAVTLESDAEVLVLARFNTISSAEHFIATDPSINAVLRDAGRYGIDAPEELVNPPVQGTSQRMHVVTVEFAIVLDEIPIDVELGNLVQGIQNAYDDVDTPMPDGSYRVVSVTGEQGYRDLDPCFNGSVHHPDWKSRFVAMTPMQALQCIRENAWATNPIAEDRCPVAVDKVDWEQFVIPFTHAPKEGD